MMASIADGGPILPEYGPYFLFLANGEKRKQEMAIITHFPDVYFAYI